MYWTIFGWFSWRINSISDYTNKIDTNQLYDIICIVWKRQWVMLTSIELSESASMVLTENRFTATKSPVSTLKAWNTTAKPPLPISAPICCVYKYIQLFLNNKFSVVSRQFLNSRKYVFRWKFEWTLQLHLFLWDLILLWIWILSLLRFVKIIYRLYNANYWM